jgi:hypothetical protein
LYAAPLDVSRPFFVNNVSDDPLRSWACTSLRLRTSPHSCSRSVSFVRQ